MLVSLVILHDRYIGVLIGQIRGQGLHIPCMASATVLLCHGLDHRKCALDGVAAGEDAGDAGAADLIRFKQAASVGFQILGAVGDRRTGALADGDNNAVRRVELLGAGDLGQRAVLGLAQIDKDNALIGDFQRLLLKIKLTPRAWHSWPRTRWP